MGDSDVAAGIGEEWAGIPGLLSSASKVVLESTAYSHQLEAFKFAAPAKAFERIMNTRRTDTVGNINDASEFFEGFEERLGDVEQAACCLRRKRNSDRDPCPEY